MATPTAPWSRAQLSSSRDSSMLISGSTVHQRNRPLARSPHVGHPAVPALAQRQLHLGSVGCRHRPTGCETPPGCRCPNGPCAGDAARRRPPGSRWGLRGPRPCSRDRSAISSSVRVTNRRPRACPLMIHHCVCGSVGCGANTGRYFSSLWIHELPRPFRLHYVGVRVDEGVVRFRQGGRFRVYGHGNPPDDPGFARPVRLGPLRKCRIYCVWPLGCKREIAGLHRARGEMTYAVAHTHPSQKGADTCRAVSSSTPTAR